MYVACDVCAAGATTARRSRSGTRGAASRRAADARQRSRNVFSAVRRSRAGTDAGRGRLRTCSSAGRRPLGSERSASAFARLSRRDTGRTLYILDEPTTGLRYDISCCSKCCNAARRRKHRRRHRAQPRRGENCGLDHRSRTRGRRRWRPSDRRGHAGRSRCESEEPHRALPAARARRRDARARRRVMHSTLEISA